MLACGLLGPWASYTAASTSTHALVRYLQLACLPRRTNDLVLVLELRRLHHLPVFAIVGGSVDAEVLRAPVTHLREREGTRHRRADGGQARAGSMWVVVDLAPPLRAQQRAAVCAIYPGALFGIRLLSYNLAKG